MSKAIGLILCFLLLACSSTNVKLRDEYTQSVAKGDFAKALTIAQGKDFYPEERSRLLKMVEVGTIYYESGDFKNSLDVFSQAKNLSDQLYTESISKKLTTVVSNDGYDQFYGARYERSMIRYYLTLSHLALYQSDAVEPKERRDHLFQARATVLDWDTLIKTFKNENDGEAVYKDDMLLKLLGAIVHRIIGNSGDLQIARQLNKDAGKLLVRNYGIYPSYNSNHGRYKNDFSKFPEMGETKVEKEYLTKTAFGIGLTSYAEEESKGGAASKENLFIVVERGLVASKDVKLQEFPIPMTTMPFTDGGGMSFMQFAMKATSASHLAKPTISFELPELKLRAPDSELTLIVKDEKGVEVKRTTLVLGLPLSEVAHYSQEEIALSTMAKTGTRLAAKHLTALLSAYATYKAQGNSPFALTVASVMYAGSAKGIAMSEKADLRQWVTLPSSIHLTSLKLPTAKYELFIMRSSTGQEMTKIGNVDLTQGSSGRIFTAHIY